jgi:RNA polymerase sigma factor (sigma-70 family)
MQFKNDLDALVMQWRVDQKNDRLMSQMLAATKCIRAMYALWFPLSDRDDIDAMLQCKIWEAAKTFDPEKSKFMSYVHTVCHNHARNVFKRSLDRRRTFDKKMLSLDQVVKKSGSQRDSIMTLADITPDPHAEIEEERAELAELARKAHDYIANDVDLTPRQKASVTLTMRLGLTYLEAAEILGCNAKSIDNAKVRAMEKLSGNQMPRCSRRSHAART